MGGVGNVDETPGVSLFTLGVENVPQSLSTPPLRGCLGCPLDQVCAGWLQGKSTDPPPEEPEGFLDYLITAPVNSSAPWRVQGSAPSATRAVPGAPGGSWHQDGPHTFCSALSCGGEAKKMGLMTLLECIFQSELL